LKRRERREQQDALQDQIEHLGLDVHARAVLAPDAMEALPVIVQSFGLGPLKANTVLFGWPEQTDPAHLAGYAEAVREIHRLGVNVVSMLSDERRWGVLEAHNRRSRRIDVWWQEDDASRLALLTAYLFTRTRHWGRAKIRVIGSVADGATPDEMESALRTMLDEARISAEVLCIEPPSADQIAVTSAGAAFVMLPARLHRGEFLGPLDLNTGAVMQGLPTTAVFLAGAPFDLTAGPETERHVRLRAAEELVQVAANRLRVLERQRERREAEIELRAEGPDWSEDDLAAAEQRLRTVERRILKAQAKLESAREEVAALLDGSSKSSR
jgi:hypothetical protein